MFWGSYKIKLFDVLTFNFSPKRNIQIALKIIDTPQFLQKKYFSHYNFS
jgi:hypothetical protein